MEEQRLPHGEHYPLICTKCSCSYQCRSPWQVSHARCSVGCRCAAPAARAPSAGSSCSDLTGVRWDLSAAEDRVSYAGISAIIVDVIRDPGGPHKSPNLIPKDNFCEKFLIHAGHKALAPHAPLLPLPRETRLRGVSWGNQGDN